MIPVQTAFQTILDQALPSQVIRIPLQETVGHILAENLYADRALPPFDRVTMDGIAIQYAVFEAGTRTFPIEGINPAGSPQQQLKVATNCIEVMTGSMLPQNTDTVIRYEDVTITDQTATIQVAQLKQGQNIHRKGSDTSQNSLLVPQYTRISPAEIGIAATIGKTHLKVLKPPHVMIISTGDELVKVSETPKAHQIRQSNVHTLQAALKNWGVSSSITHLLDDAPTLKTKLQDIIQQYAILLISGGVSKGKYDYIPEVLHQLGVQKLFHRVQQRPGKPFWFGKAPNNTLIFAFPGNPVSTFACACRYFRPWLHQHFQLAPLQQTAMLGDTVHFKPNLTYFLAVKTELKNAQLYAYPVPGNGSGDLANLAQVDGFLELPQGSNTFEKGGIYPLYLFR